MADRSGSDETDLRGRFPATVKLIGADINILGRRAASFPAARRPDAFIATLAMEMGESIAIWCWFPESESFRQLKKPAKNHHWRFGLSGPLRFTPLDGVQTSARILSDAEIRELGYVLVEADSREVLEARRMCQLHHPDRGGDPDLFMRWKYKLDKLRRRV